MLSRSPLPSDMAGPSTAPTSDVPYPVHPGGATLCYTPMIHAKVFSEAVQISKGGDGHFDLTHGEEGSRDTLAGIEGGDRPLFVQFCANDPDVLLSAAKKVEGRCDAVDINLCVLHFSDNPNSMNTVDAHKESPSGVDMDPSYRMIGRLSRA